MTQFVPHVKDVPDEMEKPSWAEEEIPDEYYEEDNEEEDDDD